MEEFIKDYLLIHKFPYEPPIPDAYIFNIYQLFNNNILNEIDDSIVLLYYGIYHYINHNEDAERCWLKAISYGNVMAMNNMLLFHYKTGDSINALKYALMAVNHGYTDGLDTLAISYFNVYDIPNAIKCWLQAIDHNNVSAMRNIATYYYSEHDFHNAQKYWLMAIENGCCETTNDVLKYSFGMDYLVIVCNKILNTKYNDQIVSALCRQLLNHDAVNVLINIDKSKCISNHHIFCLLPE